MIVAVCADKGSPGVTTLATALAVAWPGERLLLEADVAGGDLAFRARCGDVEDFIAPKPNVLDLAAAARRPLASTALPSYALATSWGVPLIQGPPAQQAYAPLKGLWSGVAREAAAWSGTVIADLGRMQPGHPGIAVARAADVVLVLGLADTAGLYHLRERAIDLSAAVGDTARERNPVGVVVRTVDHEQRQAARQVGELLSLAGSPVPVVGGFVDDDAAAAAFNVGRITRRVTSSRLLASARQLVQAIASTWPEATPERPGGDRRASGTSGSIPPGQVDLRDARGARDAAEAAR